jgi:hypothetical protein
LGIFFDVMAGCVADVCALILTDFIDEFDVLNSKEKPPESPGK